jgi:GNAT superfamily N-acetyltransferase
MHPAQPELAVTVRLAGAHDAAALAPLINRAYEIEQFFVDGERTNQREVEELQRTGRFLLLDGRDGPVAAVYVQTEGAAARIQMLSVLPELQGRGLGTRLVAVAEALCAALGCSSVGLQIVNLREELGPWYRRRGYRQTRTSPYGHRALKRPCHFVEMSKSLSA